MASKKCEIVSKSFLRNSYDLPSDNLKKFCLGLTDWCPCCIEGMVEKPSRNHLASKGPFLLYPAGSCKNLECIFLQDPFGFLQDPAVSSEHCQK